MLISENIYRDKLVNAILYFARETSHLNMMKLFKLLNFFDFEHFSETGFPAIGLEYETFRWGPVPRQLWLDVKDADPSADISKVVKVLEKKRRYDPDSREVEFKAKPGARINMDVFTPREAKILDRLAEIYKYATGSEMSEISHDEELPWKKTLDKFGPNVPIDYMLALKGDSELTEEEARESLEDYFSIFDNFGFDPSIGS